MKYHHLILLPALSGQFLAEAATLSTNPAILYEGQQAQLQVSFSDSELCQQYASDLQQSDNGYRLVISRIDQSCVEVTPVIPNPVYLQLTLPALTEGETHIVVDIPESTFEDPSEFKLYAYKSSQVGFRKINLETPIANATVSGVDLIRGWACQAIGFPGEFSYAIDNGERTIIPYGSSRTDTAEVCKNGDSTPSTNTGFGAVINWNALDPGSHTFKLYLNGALITERIFNVANTKGEYLKGLSRELEITNFPNSGDTTQLKWSEPGQNFIVLDTNTD
ncbi:MAG: hypothetical protein OIF35_01540 [Cellvibrionaceae bacterium]|nr:hypothetical protein [Cellvibrionaceae bacterium]